MHTAAYNEHWLLLYIPLSESTPGTSQGSRQTAKDCATRCVTCIEKQDRKVALLHMVHS